MQTFEDITKDKTPIIITSHPRSGTHLTIDLIRRQFPETRIKKKWRSNSSSFLSIGSFNVRNATLRLKEEEKALKLISSCRYPIIKLHTYAWYGIEKNFPHWIKWMKEKGKIIFVARDIRSVMPSMHLYEQSFNPNSRRSVKKFIRQPYLGKENRIAYWNQQMINWYKPSACLVLNFEKIIHSPELAINKISNYIGLTPTIQTPLLPKKVNSIWHARFQRLFSTNPSSTAIVGYYKGQKTKKWMELFDKEDLEFIYRNGEEGLKLLDYRLDH